ncbi:ribosome recycling factor [Candidatus Saccharibacteria bacterium]|nr:MAG: ribosome recycling factor [Candidatus Saccharibacteria bacterium]
MFDTKPYEQKMDAALEHFEGELKKVRTGRAHASMLDGVMVDVYGTKLPLNQVANVTAPEAQMLLVSPFDPGQITAITTAIRDNQGLGFNPSDDGRVVRVPVPALTEERRRDMVKQASEKVEECRIALRNVRQDALQAAKKMKDDKKLSEDDVKAIERGIDDDMKQYQSKIDEIFAAKEKDILTV